MYYAIKEQHSAPMQQGLVSLAKEQLQESIENSGDVNYILNDF